MAGCKDPDLHRDWNYLQTSDHLYYMCTKWFSDGDVHQYFNPYGSPYDAFLNYMNVLSDFLIRVNEYDEMEKLKVQKSTAKTEVTLKGKASETSKTATKKVAKTKSKA
jgi:alpha-amylase/alpha-mannosidase (GH57 family)